ncbi:MAG: hypothetical protein RI910_10 [Verrucomicrobiota bacterium]|jgi:hypothetical protein
MLAHSCLCWGLLIQLATTTHCFAQTRGDVLQLPAAIMDTDGDGIDDVLEAELGINPLAADTDGDGWDDLAELISGTDPSDLNDFPTGSGVELSAATFMGNPAHRLKASELLASRRAAVTPSGNGPKVGGDFFLSYYYLPADLSNLAVEMKREDLKAGAFILIWRHRLKWNPLGIEQRYVVTVRRDDGEKIAEWTTPAPVGMEWDFVGLPFNLKVDDEGHQLTLSLTPEGGGHLGYDLADFTAVPAGIEIDMNRDGVITANERPAKGRPLRHWVNDDDDAGACQESADVPGLTGSQADHAHPGIDGLRDLVDFLPINLNLAHVTRLVKPSEGFRYFIGNPDCAVQVALTGLTPLTTGAIHRDPSVKCFGPKLDSRLGDTEILMPDKDGRIEIPSSFLERIEAQGHGVMLLEGARPSRRPLRLEIFKGEALVASLDQPLAIMAVETMYRHVNLTRATYDYSGRQAVVKRPGRPQQIGNPPGLPDSETNDRWVVMVHGYNVSGHAARSWHAETFKRLYVLGSNARFVGVTWNGDTGLDYHKAVYHAFQTGDEVPKALGFLDASRTLLIGHSLGNIVASQAVQAGFTPAHYFLLNAALPIEALAGRDNAQQQAVEMTEEYWRPYGRKLYATDWAKLFSPGDLRRTITWEDCFSRVRSMGIATNFYSLGEDITNSPSSMVSASVLATLWSGRAIDYGAWKTQELLKGVVWSRSIAAIAMERTQGGWGFNPAWRGRYVPSGPTKSTGGYYERMDPITAGRITSAQLTQDPFFRPLYEGCLRGPRLLAPSPILDCSNMRYDLLARAIPAITFAAGAAPVPPTDSGAQVVNFNLETLGRTDPKQWPTEGHGATRLAGRWLHSDFKNVALPYVTPFYAQMIKSAALR